MGICPVTDECGNKRTRKVESSEAGPAFLLVSFIAICLIAADFYRNTGAAFAVMRTRFCGFFFLFNRNLITSFRTVTIKGSFSSLLPSLQCLLIF